MHHYIACSVPRDQQDHQQLPSGSAIHTHEGQFKSLHLLGLRGVSGCLCLSILVHRLAAATVKLVTFLPEWKSIVDGDDVIRRADQKPGYIPVLLDVLSEHFVTSVVIRKNHTLDNDSKKYLEALGLTVDLFSHS